MKVIDNEPLYQRNMRAALIANLGGMFLLVAAVLVLFRSPDQLGRYLAFLLGGILLVQLGLYFGRWAKRPDLALNRALKSLDDSYTLYHHRSPVPHLLVGPAGLWILLPRSTPGRIFYNKARQRWELQGGSLPGHIWRRFTQEKLGRPHFEAMIEADALDRFLQKHWNTQDPLHVQAAVVFLNDAAEVNAGDAPFPAVSAKKLRNTILKGEEKGKLKKAQIQKLNAAFHAGK